jgi:hypothetical protein
MMKIQDDGRNVDDVVQEGSSWKHRTNEEQIDTDDAMTDTP